MITLERINRPPVRIEESEEFYSAGCADCNQSWKFKTLDEVRAQFLNHSNHSGWRVFKL